MISVSLSVTFSRMRRYPLSSLVKNPLSTSWLSLFRTVCGCFTQISAAISLSVSPSSLTFFLKKRMRAFCTSSISLNTGIVIRLKNKADCSIEI